MYRVISSIRHIIAPLLLDLNVTVHVGNVENGEEKIGKKKKKAKTAKEDAKEVRTDDNSNNITIDKGNIIVNGDDNTSERGDGKKIGDNLKDNGAIKKVKEVKLNNGKVKSDTNKETNLIDNGNGKHKDVPKNNDNNEISHEKANTSISSEKVPEVESKKKRKKKNAEEKAKMNSSVDLNKGSQSSKNTKVDLDLPFLERQMNELYRLMERYEKVLYFFNF